jgi:prefoldin subunit 5
MLEAGNQEKIFTPLIGKGVKFFVKGKPADEILLGIKNDTRNLEVSKKRFDEVANILKNAEEALDKNSDFTKSEIKELRHAIKETKNAEQIKITDLAADLAKKIREYSNNNK